VCVGVAALVANTAAAQQPPEPQTPPPQPPPPAKGLLLQSGDFTWKFGGYIKVDAIHDFDAIGSTDTFDPRTIPTTGTGEPDESTRIHARQTRFNLDISGPTSAGPMRAFFEGDFFGDKNTFRIRHAYGTIDHVLAGQTWTTFMDEDAMPETLDFESPIAFPMVRQAQIRWTQKLESGSYAAVSIEDPDSDVIAPTGVTGVSEEPMPDLNARLYWKNSRGHVELGLFGGLAQFDPDVGSADTVPLWGVNLATKLATFAEDNAIVQITYGDGVGRYRGGTTAAPDANGDMEAVRTFGTLVSYQHFWSDKYRSTVAYSWGKGDLPGGTPTTSTEELSYFAANLIWQYCDRAWTGIEFLHGTRDTLDGASGEANRIQLSLRFDI
jgi:hypothetical protein